MWNDSIVIKWFYGDKNLYKIAGRHAELSCHHLSHNQTREEYTTYIK